MKRVCLFHFNFSVYGCQDKQGGFWQCVMSIERSEGIELEGVGFVAGLVGRFIYSAGGMFAIDGQERKGSGGCVI